MGERNHTETGIVRPDDIVERLRAATRTGDMPLGTAFDCVAVADEIERLLALADQLAVALAAQGSASFDEHTNLNIKRLALDAYKEARRG